jgi:anthranilate/para-aminobenzoate synthase component II
VEEGREIKEIVQQQQSDNTTQMAYHSLLAKKYLWDNYQPLQAREEAKKAIQLKPFSFKNYALFVLSFFPEKPVKNIYSFLNERTPDAAEKTK